MRPVLPTTSSTAPAPAGPHHGRRRMVMALPLLAAAAHWPAGLAATTAPVPQRSSRFLMGTRVDIVVDTNAPGAPGTAAADAAMAAAHDTMRQLAGSMSRYEPASVVSRINAHSGVRPVPVPPAVMAVLQSAQALAAFTGGAFDITVGAYNAWHFDDAPGQIPSPALLRRQREKVHAGALVLDQRAGTAFLPQTGMAIDLGGVAKLPILEAGLATLREHGIENALVNGGGDVLVSGLLQGRPWRIGLRDPLHPDRLLGTVTLAQGGVVASSGDYERGFWSAGRRLHHILDPHTGYPTTGVHGVALVAARVEQVNGLGAAAMVKGLQGCQAMFAARPEVHALAVGSQSTWSTAALQGIAQGTKKDIAQRTAHFQWQAGLLAPA